MYVLPVSTAREYRCHFLTPVPTGRVHGPWARMSKNDTCSRAVDTDVILDARVHEPCMPCTRVVCTELWSHLSIESLSKCDFCTSFKWLIFAWCLCDIAAPLVCLWRTN